MNNGYMQQFQLPGPRGGGLQFAGRAGDGGGWPDGLSWMILALLLVLVLLVVVSLALDAYYRSRPSGAISTLEMRYARGEIPRDDYLQARTDLGGGAPIEATTEVKPPRRGRPTPPEPASPS